MKMTHKKSAGGWFVLISTATIALFAFVVMATTSTSVAQGLKAPTPIPNANQAKPASDANKDKVKPVPTVSQAVAPQKTKPAADANKDQVKPVPAVSQAVAPQKAKPAADANKDQVKPVPAAPAKKSETAQKLIDLLQKIVKPEKADVPKAVAPQAVPSVPAVVIATEAPKTQEDLFKEFDAIKTATAKPTEQERQLLAIGDALNVLMVKKNNLKVSDSVLDGYLQDQFIVIGDNGKKLATEKEFVTSLIEFIQGYDFAPYQKEDLVRAVESRKQAVVALGGLLKVQGLITVKNTGDETINFATVNLMKYDKTAANTITLAAGQTWYFTKPVVLYYKEGSQPNSYSLEDGHSYDFRISAMNTLVQSGTDDFILVPIDADTLKKAVADQDTAVAAAVKKEKDDQEAKEKQKKEELEEQQKAEETAAVAPVATLPEQGQQGTSSTANKSQSSSEGTSFDKRSQGSVPDSKTGKATKAVKIKILDLLPNDFYNVFYEFKYECKIDGEAKSFPFESQTSDSSNTFLNQFQPNDKSLVPKMDWGKVWETGFSKDFLGEKLKSIVPEQGLVRVRLAFDAYNQVIDMAKGDKVLGLKARFVMDAVIRKYALADYWQKHRAEIVKKVEEIKDQDQKEINRGELVPIDITVNQINKSEFKSEDHLLISTAYQEIRKSEKPDPPKPPIQSGDVGQLKEQYDTGMDPDHHAYFDVTAWYGPVTKAYPHRHLFGTCCCWHCLTTEFVCDQEEAKRNNYPLHHLTMVYSCLPLAGNARVEYNCVVFADDPGHIYYYDRATNAYAANYDMRYDRFNIANGQIICPFGQKPTDVFTRGDIKIPNRVLDYQGLQTFAPPLSKTLDLLKKHLNN